MSTYHVRQRFHAVGHGTFLTGVVAEDDGTKFSWVYDCGSRRSQPLKIALKTMEDWEFWPDPIDMVVLSHFDDDHVNGVEELLKKRRVGTLVLPYFNWQQRLRDAAVGGLKGMSPSTAQMQLDPAGWLESKDLTQRVEKLLLIQGGRSAPGQDAPPDAPFFLPLGPQSGFGDDRPGIEIPMSLAADLKMNGHGASNAMQMRVLRHQQPMRIGSLPMEFMFYNAELSGSELGIIETVHGKPVAKRSRVPLSLVRKHVEKTISALGLVYPFSSLPTDWRAKLKACYQTHFGATGKAKNNISLCLSVRPLIVSGTIEPCSLFHTDDADQVHVIDLDEQEPAFDFFRPGVLYTGDLKLNKQVISEMRSHFGTTTWDQVGLTQVPHHGSTHSWTAGNAALFVPSGFVHCAPESGVHPHPDVIKDLDGQQVFVANYKSSVTLDYHFWSQ